MNISTASNAIPADASAESPSPESRMDRLISRSADVKSRADSSENSAEGWFNPDPLAITQLPAERHPIRVMFARSNVRAADRPASEKRVLVVYRILSSVPREMKDLDIAFKFPWHQITLDQARIFSDHLNHSTFKPATIAVYITTLRILLKACRQVGLIDHTRLALLLDQLNLPRIGVQDVGRALSPGEIEALFVAAANPDLWRQARNQALLAIFCTTGMRRCEVLDLTMLDWDRENRVLQVNRGKGNNPRVVPLHPDADAYLATWVSQRGNHDGPMFIGTKKRPSERMGDRSIGHILKRLADKAKIAPMSSHDFRRTAVTTLLRTTDPAVVARLVGHKSLDTTFRYDKTPLNLQRNAVNSLAVPSIASPNKADER
jgi:integrase